MQSYVMNQDLEVEGWMCTHDFIIHEGTPVKLICGVFVVDPQDCYGLNRDHESWNYDTSLYRIYVDANLVRVERSVELVA